MRYLGRSIDRSSRDQIFGQNFGFIGIKMTHFGVLRYLLMIRDILSLCTYVYMHLHIYINLCTYVYNYAHVTGMFDRLE